MNEIIAGLYLGDFKDAQQLDGFWAVIDLRTFWEYIMYPGNPFATHIPILLEICRQRKAIIIDDMDPKKVKEAIDAIDNLLESGLNVLVHCMEGRERSPWVVAVYLHIKKNMTMDDAFKLIKSKRPEIDMDAYPWPRE